MLVAKHGASAVAKALLTKLTSDQRDAAIGTIENESGDVEHLVPPYDVRDALHAVIDTLKRLAAAGALEGA